MKHPDIKVFTHDVFHDQRGEIWTLWKKGEYPDTDLEFNHDKISTSRKNVLRGLHGDFKAWKLIECIQGEVYFVIADNRPESPYYCYRETNIENRWDWMMLNDKKRQTVLLPPGIANGILVMSDSAILHYKWAYEGEYPDVDKRFTIKWNDPRIGIYWGGVNNIILQERDS